MLALDEEVDYLEYQRYLRSQSDTDLFDILSHLDPTHCPRRTESVQRELGRRHIVIGARYQDSENLWRKFLMIVIAIVVVTQFLGMTMSVDEAIAPQPLPTLDVQTGGNFLQLSASPLAGGDQMTAAVIGVYFAQLAENGLRAAVLLGSQCGGYLLILLATSWKLVVNLREGQTTDPLKQEVRKLLLVAFAGQILVLTCAAWNNLPQLANNGQEVTGGFLARAITVFAPWG
jgi:hypothetical protein